MSIFNELLPKIHEISNAFTKNFNDDLKAAFECFDKFDEEFQNGRGTSREKAQKDKNPMTTLQSIHEDEDEPAKPKEPETNSKRKSIKDNSQTEVTTQEISQSSSESNTDKPRRNSKKRSKNEVDGLLSPEQDKRHKRNASVKAQSMISKQVNVNLTQKLRRDDEDKSRSRRRKDDDKENDPVPINIQIKEEKVSLPPEPEAMDTEALPITIEIKQEVHRDEIAMPPPVAPVPKPRKGAAKEKIVEDGNEEESSGRRRTTRTRKQTESMAPPPAPASRPTRSSSRSTRQVDPEEQPAVPPEPRPKRTRAKKKVSEVTTTESETSNIPQENGIASPAEKPRPKRTRRGQKAADKQEEKPQEPPPTPKEERVSKPEVSSPILQKDVPKQHAEKTEVSKSNIPKKITEIPKKDVNVEEIRSNVDDDVDSMDKTRIIPQKEDEMDRTVVLPNGVYNHAPVTPKNVRAMNETVVIEAATRETIVLDKPVINMMDCTVVLDKEPRAKLTDDNSLLTDDEDAPSPRTLPPPATQPASAVKEKVQQFEEMASRVTRTKTRAMAKKDDEVETHTPPDKIIKPILSAETLTKMNSMIFNGKQPQISSSASKPRANIVTSTKSFIPASTSKISGINKMKETEESIKREKEDARKKKEAMLEAKRELQRKKREEKMAAAAAAREMAEKERRAAMEAAARERLEKQAHADQGKLERLKEAERKKAELLRKAAETEERRRVEELARQQRLADEQRRADLARRKQLEEAAATKREAAIMAKEIEKRQKEYIEKQRKQRMEDKLHTPLKHGWTGPALEPAYMADGFQYLNSDEDEEPVDRPVPEWSTSKARRQQLSVQCQVRGAHVDRLFSVRVHSPDLRELFPNIERARLKRTSSAVWRTPPHALPALSE